LRDPGLNWSQGKNIFSLNTTVASEMPGIAGDNQKISKSPNCARGLNIAVNKVHQ